MVKPRAVALAILSAWLLAAALMPLVQDEAYYFAWASHLALGYFDHPPLVALIGSTTRWAHGVALIARIGTMLTALLCLGSAARLFRILGLTTSAALATALVLAFGNVPGLVLGAVAAPDTGLMLAWTLALSEAALALKARGGPQQWRWVTAGLATGLGFWAKYLMVLIGPVFLAALLLEERQARRQTQAKGVVRGRPGLRTPWPYLGGLAAVLVVLPHLSWNAEHDWISLRFQLRHGFASNYMNLPRSDVLPWPDPAKVGSREWQLAEVFKGPPEKVKVKRPATAFDPVIDGAGRLAGFLGGQLALWGALAAVLVREAWQRRRRQKAVGPAAKPELLALDEATLGLVWASASVPILVFALFSLSGKVEANWAAMYLFGAAALLTPLCLGAGRLLVTAFAANLGLLALVVVHARTGLLPLRPDKDRVLTETHGYEELGRLTARLEGPVFADSYQITAMARFYSDGRQVAQWPRMTRDSEFVRLPLGSFTAAELAAKSGFWLVTTVFPPHFNGFTAVDMAELRDCKDSALQVISTTAAKVSEPDSERCGQPIHIWYLVRYETERE